MLTNPPDTAELAGCRRGWAWYPDSGVYICPSGHVLLRGLAGWWEASTADAQVIAQGRSAAEAEAGLDRLLREEAARG